MDGIPLMTVRATSDNPSIILLDHVLEKKFEGRRNVRVVACGLYELLPDHCICFRGARRPHNAIDSVEQWWVRVDKLGEVLGHDILRGDLLQEVFPSTVLQILDCNFLR